MFNFGNKKGNRGGRKSAEIRRPKLVRLDAVKNIDYEASFASDESTSLQASRSLDFSPEYSSQSSFRIGGSREGEVEHLYESLGLSGPEDFAIPIAAWEASLKFRSSSDVLPRSRLIDEEEINVLLDKEEDEEEEEEKEGILRVSEGRSGVRDVGIKGPRPPFLTPPQVTIFPLSDVGVSSVVLPLPPSMALPVVDRGISSWEIVRSFAPGEENVVAGDRGGVVDSDDDEDDNDEEEDEEEEAAEDEIVASGEVLERETSDGAGSFSTSIDDDSSSTTTEFVVSPNGRFKKKIKSWMRGHLLGSGSFGTVYEGISE